MNTDAYFEIGSTHPICEDYAIAGINKESGLAYAVVSDGCSGSNTRGPVDLGARILSHSFKQYFRKTKHLSAPYFWELPEGPEYKLNRKMLNDIHGEAIAMNSHRVIGSMDLPLETIDATIVAAISNGKKIKTFIWGDGAIIVRYQSGDVTLRYVNYESGAPFYLSYLLDPQRMDNYEKSFKHTKKTLTTVDLRDPAVSMVEDTPLFEGVYFDFDVDQDENAIEYIAVVSDGIETYRNDDNSPRNIIEIAQEFISFKTPRGAFVNRRLLNGMQKRCRREDIHHYDDISCAAIYFGEL